MFSSILATFAEFEVDLPRMRTREGMAAAKANSKQPELSTRQQREHALTYVTGEYAIADLAEVFTVSRTTGLPHPSTSLDIDGSPIADSLPCTPGSFGKAEPTGGGSLEAYCEDG